eukprot:280788_1
MSTQTTSSIRKELLKLSKKDLIKKCKKHKLKSVGNKNDMINKLIPILLKKASKPKKRKKKTRKLPFKHNTVAPTMNLTSFKGYLLCYSKDLTKGYNERYNTDTNKWDAYMDNIPENIVICGINNDETKIYSYSKKVFTQLGLNHNSKCIRVFDIMSNKWTKYAYELNKWNPYIKHAFVTSKPFEFHVLWIHLQKIQHSVWNSTTCIFMDLPNEYPFKPQQHYYYVNFEDTIFYDRTLDKIFAINVEYSHSLEIAWCDVSGDNIETYKWSNKKTINYPSKLQNTKKDMLFGFESFLFLFCTETQTIYCCDFVESYKWYKSNYKLPKIWNQKNRFVALLKDGNVHFLSNGIHISFELSHIIPPKLYNKTRDAKIHLIHGFLANIVPLDIIRLHKHRNDNVPLDIIRLVLVFYSIYA